jgi:MarR family transcriptional regulator, organic hydroperoxide resistance regulator
MNEFLALFTRSSKLARAAADEAMSRHGVRVGQNLLLEVLWETDGLTPGELAARLHVATPTVVKSANRMATAGLLVRKPDPADARLVRLYLTDRARSVRRAVERERDELEQRMTATLTSAEREHLRSSLIKIIDQLTGDPGPPQPPGSDDADSLNGSIFRPVARSGAKRRDPGGAGAGSMPPGPARLTGP